MNLKPALKLSLEIAPAEAALKRAETLDELLDAWLVECDNYAGARRWYLQAVYDECAATLRQKAKTRAEMLRLARAL